MKEQNRLLILWVIFGFIFIYALDGILHFLSNLIVIILIKINLPYEIITYSYGTTVLLLYLGTAYLVLKKLKTTSKNDGIYLTKFPVKTFVILSILGALLFPITNYLIGSVGYEIWDNYRELNGIDRMEYLTFYGFKTGINGLLNSIVYLSMIIGFIYLIKRKN